MRCQGPQKQLVEPTKAQENRLLAHVCWDTTGSWLSMQQPNNAGVGQKASVLRGGAQPEGKRSLLSQQAAGDYPAHLQFVIWAVAETWLTVEFDFKQTSSERVLPIIIPPAAHSSASVHYGCPSSCLPVDGPRSNEAASCQMRVGLLIKKIRQVRLSSSLRSINFQFFPFIADSRGEGSS